MNDRRKRRLGWASVWLLLSACETTQQVASGCPDGDCPDREVVQQLVQLDGAPCTFSEYTAQIAVQAPDVVPALCLPGEVQLGEDGMLACDLYSEGRTAEETRAICDEGAGDVLVEEHEWPRCALRQATVDREKGIVTGSGWYYDDFSEQVQGCNGARHRIAFTPDALPNENLSVSFHCGIAWLNSADSLTQVPAESCASVGRPDGAGPDVGAACTPAITPADGYDDSVAMIETGAPECMSGTCMV